MRNSRLGSLETSKNNFRNSLDLTETICHSNLMSAKITVKQNVPGPDDRIYTLTLTDLNLKDIAFLKLFAGIASGTKGISPRRVADDIWEVVEKEFPQLNGVRSYTVDWARFGFISVKEYNQIDLKL